MFEVKCFSKQFRCLLHVFCEGFSLNCNFARGLVFCLMCLSFV